AGVQGLVGADDGEQGEADGVGDLDGGAEAFDLFVAEEGEQAGGHGEGEVAPVGDGDGGDAEDDVAGHAAGGGGGKREDEDAEEVEAVADGNEAAADGEGEGADEVQEGDEGEAHGWSRPRGHSGWKPSRVLSLDLWASGGRRALAGAGIAFRASGHPVLARAQYIHVLLVAIPPPARARLTPMVKAALRKHASGR